jgi:hypothetical protein
MAKKFYEIGPRWLDLTVLWDWKHSNNPVWQDEICHSKEFQDLWM